MSTWNDINVLLPADGEHVFIRRWDLEIPYEAYFHTATNTFTIPNGLELSWVYISKWTPF